MFMDFRDDLPPLPGPGGYQKKPRGYQRKPLTRVQEKRLGLVLLANIVLLFGAAPLAGSSVIAAVIWTARH